MSEYWPSSWSGEDGGPKRQQIATNVSIPRISSVKQLEVVSRDALAMTMPIVGPHDELFLQRVMPGLDSVASKKSIQ
jgi:hypothetical protein